ncbi:uncharacterized protein IUM83_08953 [Phytophthora cinnamomi]|uniref:uncharacterized protein n=1 Tax=Phytophthora cinnamomi TaxID=4785 RepID=UPI00355A8850|nr:hypothetical protein IUM83_08953 [Phytophthora cinnamomi]
MADFRDADSSDDDQQHVDDDGGPAWETAPDNDDDEEDAAGSDEDDRFSGRYLDNEHADGSDGDFEDAWLDDYLPDATDLPLSNMQTGESVGPSEDGRASLQHLGVDSQEDSDNALMSRRSSLALEMDTAPSLMVVNSSGDAAVSVPSPRLAGFAAFKHNSEGGRHYSASVNSEPSPALIHPIPTSMSLDKSGRRDSSPTTPLTPLSPSASPYKRANSLYASPASTTTKIQLAQQSDRDDTRTGLARPRSYSQVWDSSETTKRTSSRLLDEWKRKEMWQDLKRAEENVVTPSSTTKREKSPSRLHRYKRAASDARLDTLLQTLQAEVATPSRREESVVKQRKESRKSPMRRRNSTQVVSAVMSPVSESAATPRRTRPSIASSASSAFSSSPLTLTTVPVVTPPSPAPFVPSVPLSEYEQLQQDKQILLQEKQSLQHEKQTLRAEVEKARDSSAADQERLHQLNEKIHQLNEKMAQLSEKQLQLDAVERENRTLKEETQKHEMQALSSNELVKTLRDQLALTSKSEEQLKLQTKQLMEQNQTLQADLLEKIASETSKFQKMAKLSAENESLMEELERKENAIGERELEERLRMRGLIIHVLD